MADAAAQNVGQQNAAQQNAAQQNAAQQNAAQQNAAQQNAGLPLAGPGLNYQPAVGAQINNNNNGFQVNQHVPMAENAGDPEPLNVEENLQKGGKKRRGRKSHRKSRKSHRKSRRSRRRN